MVRYTLRRLLHAVPLLLGVLALVFLVMHAAPGDPTAVYFHPDVPPEVARTVRRSLGLDEPLHVRFWEWVTAFATGEFGYSFSRGRPVAEVLGGALPETLLLGGAALGAVFAAGCSAGAWQALRAGSLSDRAASVAGLAVYSLPAFWLALMLILLFSWPGLPDFLRLPLTGATSVAYGEMGTWERLLDRARHLALPALALSAGPAAGVARFVRSSTVEEMGREYVTAARAWGLSERQVVGRHALRNGLLPVASLLGLYLPGLLGGALVVEVVFSWPGMGRLLYEGVLARDYPLVLAATFVFGVLVVVGNLAADLLYAALDPRVRYDGGRRAGR